MKVTYIKIEGGKVSASDGVKPIKIVFEDREEECNAAYNELLEKFNQSFVEVSNAEDLPIAPGDYPWYDFDKDELVDGVYPVNPVEGMVMEVKEQYWTGTSLSKGKNLVPEWVDLESDYLRGALTIRKVCTISLEPVEDSEVEKVAAFMKEKTNKQPEGLIKRFESLLKGWDNHNPNNKRFQAEYLVSILVSEFKMQIEPADGWKVYSETIQKLKSTMIAAAEEIQAHWQAHCDAGGYGPSNLMHRLEKGIGSFYSGYSAGQFTKLEQEMAELKRQITSMRQSLPDGDL